MSQAPPCADFAVMQTSEYSCEATREWRVDEGLAEDPSGAPKTCHPVITFLPPRPPGLGKPVERAGYGTGHNPTGRALASGRCTSEACSRGSSPKGSRPKGVSPKGFRPTGFWPKELGPRELAPRETCLSRDTDNRNCHCPAANCRAQDRSFHLRSQR